MSGSSTFSNYWPFPGSLFDVYVTCPLFCGFLISFSERFRKPLHTAFWQLFCEWELCFFYKWFLQDDDTSGSETSCFLWLNRKSYLLLFYLPLPPSFFHRQCERCVCGENRFVIMTRNWMMPCSWCILHTQHNISWSKFRRQMSTFQRVGLTRRKRGWTFFEFFVRPRVVVGTYLEIFHLGVGESTGRLRTNWEMSLTYRSPIDNLWSISESSTWREG